MDGLSRECVWYGCGFTTAASVVEQARWKLVHQSIIMSSPCNMNKERISTAGGAVGRRELLRRNKGYGGTHPAPAPAAAAVPAATSASGLSARHRLLKHPAGAATAATALAAGLGEPVVSQMHPFEFNSLICCINMQNGATDPILHYGCA